MTPEQFRAIRDARQLTQAGLAPLFHVDVRTVRRWEADPSVDSHRAVEGTTEALAELIRDHPVVVKWLKP